MDILTFTHHAEMWIEKPQYSFGDSRCPTAFRSCTWCYRHFGSTTRRTGIGLLGCCPCGLLGEKKVTELAKDFVTFVRSQSCWKGAMMRDLKQRAIDAILLADGPNVEVHLRYDEEDEPRDLLDLFDAWIDQPEEGKVFFLQYLSFFKSYLGQSTVKLNGWWKEGKTEEL